MIDSHWLAGFLIRKKLTVLGDEPVFKKRPVCDVVLREYRQNIKRLRKGKEFEFRNLFIEIFLMNYPCGLMLYLKIKRYPDEFFLKSQDFNGIKIKRWIITY